MKLLFISGNLTDGGAQRVISVVSSYLAEHGHDVSLFLFSRSDKEYPISEKVKITSISANFEEYKKVSLAQRLKFIRKHLKDYKPDVGVGFLEGGYALYLASFGMRFAKIASARIDPKVLFAAKGFRSKINKMWFSSADAVVLQTESQKNHVTKKMLKRCVIIPNPVSERALMAEKSSYDCGCRFVMAGRLSDQKNYPLVFDAVRMVKATHPDVHVDIYGKGAEEQKLSGMIADMGISDNVSLKGWTQDTVGEYLQHDAYIMSSDFEGMPNALMEAMAAGLPCISTDCDTGPSDLITDGENGYLIPVGDAAALAEKMVKIIEMTPDERRAIGRAARENIKEHYNGEVICKKWESAFLSFQRMESL